MDGDPTMEFCISLNYGQNKSLTFYILIGMNLISAIRKSLVCHGKGSLWGVGVTDYSVLMFLSKYG